jgi:hypothetical protein
MTRPRCLNTSCDTPIPSHVDRCVACGRDVGSPNVRIANSEAARLDERYRLGCDEASKNGVLPIAEHLEKRLATSRAVICRSWSEGAALLSSDKKTIPTFYGRIAGELELPEENEYDEQRGSVDAAVFPLYFAKIRCAALSIRGDGNFGYGECGIVLKEDSIRDRTSVFEENSFVFCRKRNVGAANKVPEGYRAVWSQRERLGIAKLGSRLRPDMDDAALEALVLDNSRRDGDFIEVHVYGTIHRRSVAAVVGRTPSNDLDSAIVRELEKVLRADGVPFQLVS